MIGTTLDAKYAILKELGEGGMGAVYLARHLGTSRLVALKVIIPRMTKRVDFVERFRREAEAAGGLRHPNVVDVTDFGFARVGDDEIAYLVMEYLDGCSLAEILDEEKTLPLEWVVDILEQTCSAVEEAHRRGIIHRDLKPHNIWLEPNRRGGYTVKVLDFGLAKVYDAATSAEADASEPIAAAATAATAQTDGADEPRSLSDPRSYDSLTKLGTIVGTPYYMSPEQCRGRVLDARSDVYSLGIIAYEMLAHRPFTGSAVDVLAKQVLDAAPHLSDVAPGVPRRVGDVVMSALEKDPAQRPQRALLFGRTLRANAEGFGAVIRNAVALCTQNVPAFLRLFAIAYGPLVALRVVKFLGDAAGGLVPEPIMRAWDVGFGVLILGAAMFLAAAVARGVSALLLAQIEIAPLRRVRVDLALGVLRKRLAALVGGSLVYLVLVAIPLAIFVISAQAVMRTALAGVTPAGFEVGRELVALGWLAVAAVAGAVTLRNFTTYSLFPIALLLEGQGLREALARSRALVARGRVFVIPVACVEIFEYLAEIVIGALLVGATPFPLFDELIVLVADTGLELVTGPIEAIAYAVVYLKLRQMGGESMNELLGEQLVEQEIPKTRWMQRMRKRAASGVSGV